MRPATFAFLALYTLICCLAVALRPAEVFWTVDNGNKWLQSQSASGYDLMYPGQSLDPEMRFVPIGEPFAHVVEDGSAGATVSRRLLSQYPPTFAAVSRPFLALGEYGRFVLPLLGAALTAWGAAVLAARLGASPLWALAFAGPLGPVMFYASTFWEHTLVTALLIWAWCWVVSERTGVGPLVTAALFFAAATALREETVLLAAATGGGMLLGHPRFGGDATATFGSESGSPWKRPILFGLAYMLFLSPFLLWMKAETGSFFGLHFQGNLGSEGWSPSARWTVLRALLWSGDEGALEALAGIATVVAMVILGGLYVRSRRTNENTRQKRAAKTGVGHGAKPGTNEKKPSGRPQSPFGVSSGIAACLVGVAAILTAWSLHRETEMPQTLVRTAGLLLFAPWSAWILRGLRATTLHWTAFFGLVLFVVVTPPISVFGVHWGPRILLSAVPLLAVLAAQGLSSAASDMKGMRLGLRRGAFGVMIAGLVSLQLYGLFVQYRLLDGTGRLLETTRARAVAGEATGDATGDATGSSPRPVLTHFFWYAQVLAPLYLERPVYQVRRPNEFREWVERFAASGGRSFFWVAAPGNAEIPADLPLRKVRTETWNGYPRIYDHQMIEIEVVTKDLP